jgi:Ca-activated chloride channel family protein
MGIKFQLLVCWSIVLLLLLVFGGCDKSSSPTGPGAGSVTQIAANGSLAPVSRTQAQGTLIVADQNGNAVTGLASENVAARLVWGLPKASAGDSVVGTVTIQTVTQSGKNIAVALTMDYSGSMYVGNYDETSDKYQRIIDMESGVKTFINALKITDEAEIIKFDDVVHVVQPFTSSKQLLSQAVDSVLYLGGATALFQSIYTGVQDVATQSASSYARAVVAFTDGGENSSSIDMTTLLQTAQSNSIPVYTIGLLDSVLHSTPPGYYSDEANLVMIADSTGGFYFYAPSAAQLTQVYDKISGQLSNAYSMSITWPSSSLPASGTTVTAIITVTYNGLTSVYSRTYTMP